jgi:ubiquinone biosynthesis protein
VVEGYITKNVGPRALLRDLRRTALVLSRFGPKLPGLVEAQLIRQAEPPPPPPKRDVHPVVWMAAGGGLVALGLWAGLLIQG